MTTRKQLTAILVSTSSLMMATAHARGTGQQPAPVFAAGTTILSRMNSLTQTVQDTSMCSSADSAMTPIKEESVKAPQVQLNPAAVKFVREYLKKNDEGLQKVAQRSKAVFRIMEPILAKYKLPLELKYLAVVESDLKRTAVSRVGAAGPWQLMPMTARELGLKVTKKWDERKQYHQSTTAAAKYLRDLYKTYGDWLLVIAAYNAGPGVINKAIRRSGSRNFWKLQSFLPAETRGHVKRFIGTHYYFEETGGETTLTKAENIAYTKALAQFTAMQQPELKVPKYVAAVLPESWEAEELKEPAEIVLVKKDK